MIKNYHLSCRLEFVKSSDLKDHRLKFACFDVGHNPDAIVKTLRKFSSLVKGKKYAVVYGCKIKKDFISCIETLNQHSEHVYLVSAAGKSNVVSAQDMTDSTGTDKVKVVENGNIAATLRAIEHDINVDGVLVIGSFTVMREGREYFGVKDIVDE